MKNNKKGFTLVELVIVVAVMAILVAVAIPNVSSITDDATDAVNKSNAQTIESVLKLAEANSAGSTDSAAEIAQAVVDAKLGITKGSFTYNVKTGVVEAVKAVENDAEITPIAGELYTIVFTPGASGANASVTVTDGSDTATMNMDAISTTETTS